MTIHLSFMQLEFYFKVILAVYKELVEHCLKNCFESVENCLDDSKHIMLKIRLANLDNKSKLFFVYVNAMASFNLVFEHTKTKLLSKTERVNVN